jgi:2-methylcitrate dehydratase PrpD
MSEALTRSLAAFVSDLRLTAVPADALTVMHTGFADCIGTMIAGSIEDPPTILRKVLAPAPGDASLYLTGPRVLAARSTAGLSPRAFLLGRWGVGRAVRSRSDAGAHHFA